MKTKKKILFLPFFLLLSFPSPSLSWFPSLSFFSNNNIDKNNNNNYNNNNNIKNIDKIKDLLQHKDNNERKNRKKTFDLNDENNHKTRTSAANSNNTTSLHPNLKHLMEGVTNPPTKASEVREREEEQGYMPNGRKRVFHEKICEKNDERHHFWKYFMEAGEANHLDKRYFDPKIDVSHHTRKVALSLLWKEWVRFCQEHNLLFWIAHGTLLGWYRTGRLIPWDNDVDVESTADEVVRVMRSLNGTRWGRYHFDVNAHAHRRQLDHSNIVDARFIDTLNGLYVDVAGVTYDPTSDLYHDKEPMLYEENLLFPLQVVILEGERVFAPHQPKKLLVMDYGEDALTEREYNGHVFDFKKSRWVRWRP